MSLNKRGHLGGKVGGGEEVEQKLTIAIVQVQHHTNYT